MSEQLYKQENMAQNLAANDSLLATANEFECYTKKYACEYDVSDML